MNFGKPDGQCHQPVPGRLELSKTGNVPFYIPSQEELRKLFEQALGTVLLTSKTENREPGT